MEEILERQNLRGKADARHINSRFACIIERGTTRCQAKKKGEDCRRTSKEGITGRGNN